MDSAFWGYKADAAFQPTTWTQPSSEQCGLTRFRMHPATAGYIKPLRPKYMSCIQPFQARLIFGPRNGLSNTSWDMRSAFSVYDSIWRQYSQSGRALCKINNHNVVTVKMISHSSGPNLSAISCDGTHSASSKTLVLLLCLLVYIGTLCPVVIRRIQLIENFEIRYKLDDCTTIGAPPERGERLRESTNHMSLCLFPTCLHAVLHAHEWKWLFPFWSEDQWVAHQLATPFRHRALTIWPVLLHATRGVRQHTSIWPPT